MAHQLAFSKIHIIEWLWKIHPSTGAPDRRTGLEIYKELRMMLALATSQRLADAGIAVLRQCTLDARVPPTYREPPTLSVVQPQPTAA